MSDPIEVLDYWLQDVGPEGWYAAGDALDAEIKDRFHDLWIAAQSGGLEHWNEGVAGSLAFIILCDQFSRNMHRGTAAAFATDAHALAAARIAVTAGWDLEAPEPERQFFYMPFEHSEDPADQDLAVNLLTDRLPLHPDMALHARAHREVISKFGRFPFRNVALGRETTELERQFLTDGGYATVVAALHAQVKA